MQSSKRYWYFAGFLGLLIVGLLVFTFASRGYYPVLMVNGTLISNGKFKQDFQADSFYYLNQLKTYHPEEAEAVVIPTLDLEASVLNRIVENVLVREEAQKEFGTDLDVLVADKLTRFNNDIAFQGAAESLYGLPFADFRERVLVPQAQRDVLSGRLFLRGEKIEDWLLKAKAQAKIRIFAGDFYWDGKAIRLTSEDKKS